MSKTTPDIVDSATPVVVDASVTEATMAAIRATTKAHLDAQPKVTVRLRNAGKNEPNFETVQINGYTYQIKRGEDVQVPLPVKEILVEANII